MIQEILGCWWTKSAFLTATKEEILALASDETKLNYLAKNISLILDDDDFFYTSPELMEKLCYLFYEKRFASKHTKETVTNLNRILDTIHEYKSMSRIELSLRIKKWVKDERKNHGVDIYKLVFQGPESLYQLIKDDYYEQYQIYQKEKQKKKEMNKNQLED